MVPFVEWILTIRRVKMAKTRVLVRDSGLEDVESLGHQVTVPLADGHGRLRACHEAELVGGDDDEREASRGDDVAGGVGLQVVLHLLDHVVHDASFRRGVWFITHRVNMAKD